MMHTLYDYSIDILNKRVPVEGTQVKIDQIISKIFLADISDSIVLENHTRIMEVEQDGIKIEQKVEVKRNTDEKALILIKVP
jgi:hypothetical protein